MEIINLFLLSYGLALITWLFYLAVMNLVRVRHQLHPFAKLNAYIILAVGLSFDLLLNITVGSLLFLEPPNPKRLLLTARLNYHGTREHGWRTKLANWLCQHLLNQFDPSGKHCGR